MTLELERLAAALGRIGDAAETDRVRALERVANARSALRAADDITVTARRVLEARTSWLLAEPLEPPTTRHPRPAPRPYTVVAVDGSHAELDRFAATSCAIVNLGGWRITYSDAPAAEPLGDLRVLTGDDLAFENDSAADRDASVVDLLRGAPLGALRQAEELRFIAEAAREALAERANHPAIGLVDGNLVLWSLAATSDAATRRILDDGALAALDVLREVAARAPFAFGGYVSHPGSTEVVNMLRVQAGVCYRTSAQRVECTRCEERADDGSRPCDTVATTDRRLFAALLAPGERSAAFRSITTNTNSVQVRHYQRRGHHPAFCYVAVGDDEIARLEFPDWLVDVPGALELLHAAVLDQCERGWGYPIALQEAHERAVLTAEDRRAFETLVEREIERRGLVGASAGKRMSKRVRAI